MADLESDFRCWFEASPDVLLVLLPDSEAAHWTRAPQPAPARASAGAAIEATLPRPASNRPPAEPAPSVRASVLVVDDNADLRSYISELLSPSYDVQTVGSSTRSWSWRASRASSCANTRSICRL